MDELQTLLIERQCLRLMTLYNYHLDRVDADGFVSIFTDDCVWARVGQDPLIELKGHDALRDFMAVRIAASPELRRHHLANPLVTVHGPDDAEGWCLGLVVMGPRRPGGLPVPVGGIELVGEYRDVYRREASGWRIARRELTKVMDVEAA